MSEVEPAGGSDGDGDECPLCLEPLAPLWDNSRLATYACCGQRVCGDCDDNRREFLGRAASSGSFGREEEQLRRCCPLCRAEISSTPAKGMLEKFDKGILPLSLYNGLGECLLAGNEGVVQNVAKGMEIIMLGAERGDPYCQYSIGSKYFEGQHGLPKSTSEAKRWYMAAVEQGHSKAEYILARMFGDEGNDAELVRYLRGSASKGYDQACFFLGEALYNGEYGLPKSTVEAKRWMLSAMEQGHAGAEYNIAFVLKDEGNDADFLRHLRGSASKGFDQACFELGRAHYNGKHGLQDSTEEAIRVLTPAAERGHAMSMSVLGHVLINPSHMNLPPSMNPTFTEGTHWIRRAAEKGVHEPLGMLEEMASSNCFMCLKDAPREKAFLRCSRCCAAWYCSKDCQRRHWKAKAGGHKQFCIKWK